MAKPFPLTLFEQVYRRAPSDADRIRLLNVKANLGLSDHDELWALFMTLDHYTAISQTASHKISESLARLPGQVEAVVATAETAAVTKAIRAMERIVEKGADKLMGIVEQRFTPVTQRINKKHYITAAVVGAVVTLTLLSAGAGAYLLLLRSHTVCTSATKQLTDGSVWCRVD